ncbi:MAG: type II secretion system protein [Oligosphaeraceae bacterium]
MKRNFTLVEILVVIGIVAVLAAMLLAGLGGATGKAENAKAKSQIKDLQNAIAQFQLEYNKLPKPKGYDGKVLDSNQYGWLLEVLAGETPDKASTYGNPNTRKKQFLTLDKDNNYLDPWDAELQVVFEKGYRKGIVVKDVLGSSKTGAYGLVVPNGQKNSDNEYYFKNYDVLVWSMGRDGKQSKDDCGNKDNEDNVYSVDTSWTKSYGHEIQR